MDITVTDAVLHAVADGPNMWALNVEITPHHGASFTWAYVMPEDIIEKRTAEYDLDLTDPRSVLDGILYEPWLSERDTTEDHPHGLWRAPDIATARQHYLTSITRHRGRGVVTDSDRRPGEGRPGTTGRKLLDNDDDPDSPLTMLVREMTPDPGRVAVLRELISRARAATVAVTALSDEQLRRRPTSTELAAALTVTA